MDLNFTSEQIDFRKQARSWLESNVPSEPLSSFDTKDGFEQHRAWEKKLHAGGWAMVPWPVEYGGRGADLLEWLIFEEEYYRANAPGRVNQNGIFLLGPTIMEYGTDEQKARFLPAMASSEEVWAQGWSEPNAGSDMAAIAATAVRDGDHYVINGHKWYISGACNKNTKIMIVMGKTDPDSDNRYAQQSMILVPMDAEGVTVVRPMKVFGFDDAPEGHAEVTFENVRVPTSNLLLGEGRGFEIAQGRLGPGRIHHCMRLVGMSQRALEMMCVRAETRIAFGKPLSKQQSVREDIARSACEIEQARLLTFKAAARMDEGGNKAAKDLIAMIKIIAPSMACTIIDRAIQIHGAAGVSQDFFLAHAYAAARSIRLADGPDQVHMMQLGRNLAAATTRL